MLGPEETLALVFRAQSGDEDAKNALVQHNFPLIKSIIRRFKNPYVEYEDLYQIGAIGFTKAIKNFKSEYGVKFSTYVVPLIIGEVKRFLRDDGFIKVPRSVKMQNVYITRFIKSFTQANGRAPSIKELATEFKLDEEELMFVMDSGKMPISLYTPFENSSQDLLLIDRLKSHDPSDDTLTKIMLQDALSSLPARERQIIILRYFNDKTQGFVARVLNISQVQVSRIENKVLALLKQKLSTQ